MSKSYSQTILLIDKVASVKETVIKNVTSMDDLLSNLYKKCGFKTDKDFIEQCTWKLKIEKVLYKIYLYAKTVGKANYENKYDFPPPVDNKLFFATCCLFAEEIVDNKNKTIPVNLTVKLWDKMYEKMFGGFEDLTNTVKEDINEVDVLSSINPKKLTSSGYLKDGFIVEDNKVVFYSDDEDADDDDDFETEDETDSDMSQDDINTKKTGYKKKTIALSVTEDEIEINRDELVEEEYVK